MVSNSNQQLFDPTLTTQSYNPYAPFPQTNGAPTVNTSPFTVPPVTPPATTATTTPTSPSDPGYGTLRPTDGSQGTYGTGSTQPYTLTAASPQAAASGNVSLSGWSNLKDPTQVAQLVAYYATQKGANPSLKNDPNYWIQKITSGELGSDPNYIISKFMLPEGSTAGTGTVAPVAQAAPLTAPVIPPAPSTDLSGAIGAADIASTPIAQQSQSFLDLLLGRANESLNVKPSDPIIQAQSDAYNATGERQLRNYLSQQAEQGGPNQNLDATTLAANENLAQGEAGFVGQAMQNELTARRSEVAQALSLYGSTLNADQQAQLQEELAKLDAAISQAQLGQSAYQFGVNANQNAYQFGVNTQQNAYQFDVNQQDKLAGF